MKPFSWIALSISTLFFLTGLCFFLFVLLFNQSNDKPCITPKIEINPSSTIMTTYLSDTMEDFPSTTTITTPATKKTTFEDKFKLLPSFTDCGYLYNKDDFPWLAHIPVNSSSMPESIFDSKEIRCTGFLINKRYVITNGICGVSYHPGEKVYLGLYNRGENISCTGFQDCTEFRKEMKVSSRDYYNRKEKDFVLLRLEKQLSYSDYIKPICLPLYETIRARPGSEVLTSGWGAPQYKSSGLVKKRLKYTLKGIETQRSGRTEMYAVPKIVNHTVSLGDNGGPLMFSYRHRWFAEGMINFDIMPCENPQYDVTALRITPSVVQWIVKTINP